MNTAYVIAGAASGLGIAGAVLGLAIAAAYIDERWGALSAVVFMVLVVFSLGGAAVGAMIGAIR